QSFLEEAVAWARQAGVGREVGYSLALLAQLAHGRGDMDEAERLSVEALEVLRLAGDRDALQSGLGISARLAIQRGDMQRARAQLEEAVALHGELYRVPMVADVMLLASLDRESGDLGRAARRLKDIIGAAGTTVDAAPILFALAGLARLTAEWGDPR